MRSLPAIAVICLVSMPCMAQPGPERRLDRVERILETLGEQGAAREREMSTLRATHDVFREALDENTEAVRRINEQLQSGMGFVKGFGVAIAVMHAIILILIGFGYRAYRQTRGSANDGLFERRSNR